MMLLKRCYGALAVFPICRMYVKVSTKYIYNSPKLNVCFVFIILSFQPIEMQFRVPSREEWCIHVLRHRLENVFLNLNLVCKYNFVLQQTPVMHIETPPQLNSQDMKNLP